MERFTISMDDKLATEFDAWVAQRGYANRSEAFRDIVRAEMDRSKLHTHPKGQCVACLSYVFNHHERELASRLAHLLHEHHDVTLSTMHVHLDHEHCLETVLLRGGIASVQGLADAICAERGVHHGKLNLITVDVHLPHTHKKGEKAHTHIKPST